MSVIVQKYARLIVQAQFFPIFKAAIFDVAVIIMAPVSKSATKKSSPTAKTHQTLSQMEEKCQQRQKLHDEKGVGFLFFTTT